MESALAAGIIGFVIGTGLTVLIGFCSRSLVKSVERRAEPKHLAEGQSQYFHQNDDGEKIIIEDDDGDY